MGYNVPQVILSSLIWIYCHSTTAVFSQQHFTCLNMDICIFIQDRIFAVVIFILRQKTRDIYHCKITCIHGLTIQKKTMVNKAQNYYISSRQTDKLYFVITVLILQYSFKIYYVILSVELMFDTHLSSFQEYWKVKRNINISKLQIRYISYKGNSRISDKHKTWTCNYIIYKALDL